LAEIGNKKEFRCVPGRSIPAVTGTLRTKANPMPLQSEQAERGNAKAIPGQVLFQRPLDGSLPPLA
jgi:hypothetical protein